MANGYANGHHSTDPHGNGHSDPAVTLDVESMEATPEFRLLMAYTQRRRPGDARFSKRDVPGAQQGDVFVKLSGETGGDVEERRKRRGTGMKGHLKRMSCCVQPQQEVSPMCDPVNRSLVQGGGEDSRQELEQVAHRLTQIADQVKFTPSDLECDAEEDDLEKVLGLLLREKGDDLNERVLKDANLTLKLGSYTFFKLLMAAFLNRMGYTPPQAGQEPLQAPEVQIALTCEVTNRLSVVNTHPMSRLMGFGARYLKEHYSKWAAQQGGYEVAIVRKDEDNNEEVH